MVGNLVYTGKSLKPEVTVCYNGVALESGEDYSIKYSNNKNASLTANVTVTGKGNYSGKKKVYFTIYPKNIAGLDISVEDGKYKNGKEIAGKVVVKDGKTVLRKSRDYTITYVNNTQVGTATVTITGKGNYVGDPVEKTFRIVTEMITKAKVKKISPVTYDGSLQKPGVVVYLKNVNDPLVEGRDYTVEYPEISNTNAGTAKLYIEGCGIYGGRKAVTYKINKCKLTSFNPDFELRSAEPVVYTGNKVKTKVELYYKNTLLTEGTDYTLSYKNNTKVTDSALVTIKGKGNYSNSWKTTFSILPASISDTEVISADIAYKRGMPAVPKITVKYAGKKLKQNRDYRISYEPNMLCQDGTVIIEGIGNFAGEDKKTVGYHVYETAINKAKIGAIPTLVITENEILEPVPNITYKGKKLVEMVDYTITYQNNDKPGKAVMIIKGIGTFGGEKKIVFKINKKK